MKSVHNSKKKKESGFMDRKKQFLLNMAYYGTIGLILFLSVKYFLPVFLPFAAAAVIACILSRIHQKFFRWVPFSRKHTMLLLVTAGYGLIIGIVILAVKLFLPMAGDFLVKLPEFYQDKMMPAVEAVSDRIEQMAFRKDPAAAAQIGKAVDRMLEKLGQGFTEASAGIMRSLPKYMTRIPGLVIQWVVMIISTYFIAADYDQIIRFLKRNLPKKGWNLCCKVKKYGLHTIAAYLKSYALLMLLTLVELWAGLWLLRIPYAGWISFGIAVFDILPIVGTGGILLPWAAVSGFLGNYSLAAGILTLYLVITVIRNILEPKIVGKQIGLPPLAALISMFAGAKLAGVIGLFLFPIALILWMHIRNEKTSRG